MKNDKDKTNSKFAKINDINHQNMIINNPNIDNHRTSAQPSSAVVERPQPKATNKNNNNKER